MTHSTFRSMLAVTAAVLLTLASCKKDSGPSSDNQVTSLLFDAASPEAREALATPVNFRLTNANYAQWEQAQRFLDALPRSTFASASGAGGNAIDRAVATLEASPRARTAIERTGLTVRDFVLETVALAQAAEAGAVARRVLDPGVTWWGWHVPAALEAGVVLVLGLVMLAIAIWEFSATE